MPDIFDQRRDEHLKKSRAFLQEANNLFRDDLLYRSALADAVSAIKHSLQAYLWTRVASGPAGDQRQRWQEVALDGSMPQLLSAARDAGLQIRDMRQKILDMNAKRNERTHDSPHSPINPEQAAQAVQTARAVYELVLRAEVRMPPGVAPSAVSLPVASGVSDTQAMPRTTEPVRVGPADAVGKSSGTAPAASTPPRPAPLRPTGDKAARDASPIPVAGSETPDDDGDDSRLAPLTDGPIPFPRRRAPAWRWLGLAAAVVVGVVTGSAVTYPVAGGNAPTWLPLRGYLPGPAATATLAPTPTATAVPIPNGPIQVGALTITLAACGVAPRTITLTNTGTTALNWAAGSPDVPGSALAPFTAKGEGPTRPTLTGRLAAHASAMIALAGSGASPAHVVIIDDAGTAEMALGPC